MCLTRFSSKGSHDATCSFPILFTFSFPFETCPMIPSLFSFASSSFLNFVFFSSSLGILETRLGRGLPSSLLILPFCLLLPSLA